MSIIHRTSPAATSPTATSPGRASISRGVPPFPSPQISGQTASHTQPPTLFGDPHVSERLRQRCLKCLEGRIYLDTFLHYSSLSCTRRRPEPPPARRRRADLGWVESFFAPRHAGNEKATCLFVVLPVLLRSFYPSVLLSFPSSLAFYAWQVRSTLYLTYYLRSTLLGISLDRRATGPLYMYV